MAGQEARRDPVHGVGGLHQGPRLRAQRRAEPPAQDPDRQLCQGRGGVGGRVPRRRPGVVDRGEGAGPHRLFS